MGIKLRLMSSGEITPLICCDICGGEIDVRKDPRGCAVVWSRAPQVTAKDQTPLYAHKGDCHSSAEAYLAQPTSWDELHAHLIFLGHSVGLPLDELQRLDRLLETRK